MNYCSQVLCGQRQTLGKIKNYKKNIDMAICGYNTKIGSGLKLLFDGMIDSMEEKALKSSEIEALDDEIRELNVMIERIQNQGVIQDIFIGLDILAMHFFIDIRKQLKNNPNESLRSLAEKLAPSFIMTIKGAEEYRNDFESVPNEKEDQNYAIKLVADWVNKNGHCDYEKDIKFEL